ncbi:hypothetical protein ACTXT7_014076 [Hymenolepis weldensis]
MELAFVLLSLDRVSPSEAFSNAHRGQKEYTVESFSSRNPYDHATMNSTLYYCKSDSLKSVK